MKVKQDEPLIEPAAQIGRYLISFRNRFRGCMRRGGRVSDMRQHHHAPSIQKVQPDVNACDRGGESENLVKDVGIDSLGIIDK